MAAYRSKPEPETERGIVSAHPFQIADNKMRYIYISICLGLFIMGGTHARSHVSGAETQKPLFSLDVRKMPLAQVLDEISETSGYDIVFRGEGGEENLPISLRLEDVTLDEMLRRVLRDMNHTALWDEAEKTILLSAYSDKSGSKKKGSQGVSALRAMSPGKGRRSKRGQSLDMSGFGRPATSSERRPAVSVSGSNTRFVQTTDTTE